VIEELQRNGYDTVRAASSKGLADVVAIKAGQVLLVNCKRTKAPGPAERADLLRIAAHLPGVGVPIVAIKPLGMKRPQFWQLTGVGPKERKPWFPCFTGGDAA